MNIKTDHLFSDLNIRKPNFCVFCKKLLWGSIPQAVECMNCGLVAHTFCASNLTANCSKRKQVSIITLRNPFKKSKYQNKKTTTVKESNTLISEKLPDRRSTILGSQSISGSDSAFDFCVDLLDSDLEYPSELPTLESFIGVSQCKALSSNSKKLHHVFNEIAHTERSHLRILKTLNVLFRRPMEEYFPEEAELIFPGLSELVEMHGMLVREFKQRSEKNIVNDQFADSLAVLFNESLCDRFTEACSAFCSDQNYCLAIYTERLKIKPDFAEFINEAEKSSLCRGLKLKDLMITQMQRITRYILLIDQLIKYSKVSEETRKLQEIKTIARKCLAKVNEQAAKRENYHYLVNLIPLVDVRPDAGLILPPYDTFDVADKTLLYKGMACIKLNKKNMLSLILLFDSDLVILNKGDGARYVLRTHADKSPNSFSCEALVSPVISLTKDIVIRLLASDKNCFLVLNQKKLQLLEFQVNSAEAAKKWVGVITTALNQRLASLRAEYDECVYVRRGTDANQSLDSREARRVVLPKMKNISQTLPAETTETVTEEIDEKLIIFEDEKTEKTEVMKKGELKKAEEELIVWDEKKTESAEVEKKEPEKTVFEEIPKTEAMKKDELTETEESIDWDETNESESEEIEKKKISDTEEKSIDWSETTESESEKVEKKKISKTNLEIIEKKELTETESEIENREPDDINVIEIEKDETTELSEKPIENKESLSTWERRVPTCRLKKITSLHERTSILLAQRKFPLTPLIGTLIHKFNSVLDDIESNTDDSSDYLRISGEQVANLNSIVEIFEKLINGGRTVGERKCLTEQSEDVVTDGGHEEMDATLRGSEGSE